ncbi:HK97-gp10 family putative phage morphogenesis protein [Bacillus infantis]|uniref:HK97 gp10 family phage protein n=1 Tax=Bacillus infantis TaxID=324767 RepID=A0A5D4RGZ8_9BACI|nr:HK97-gp10 family putative phage morphogenesis protein [Bacillus infantis]TYS50089.1 hypothetical protein FZD51_05915 [Bacillus infantis]
MPAELEGLSQLISQVTMMGQSVSHQTKEKALTAGAEVMKQAVENEAPVRKGILKENIAITDVEGEEIHVGIDQQGDAFYAHIVEFGRKAGVAKIKRNGKKVNYPYPAMAPKPFMGPAFENSKQAVQEAMSDVVKRELGI